MTYTYTTRYALPYQILRYRLGYAGPKPSLNAVFKAEWRRQKQFLPHLYALNRECVK